MYTIELSQKEFDALSNLLALATKSGGLQAAQPALAILQKAKKVETAEEVPKE